MHLIRYNYPSYRSLSPAFRFSGRNPWHGLETEIDQLFETALGHLSSGSSSAGFPIDLFEDKQNLFIRAELPGVDRKDIQIEIVDGNLNLQATRKTKRAEAEQSFVFNRTLSLPSEVLADKVSASFENGVLSITLPKKEESKSRKIQVSIN